VAVLPGPLSCADLGRDCHRYVAIDVRDAGQLVRQRVLTQRTGLVEGAPRAIIDALRHVDDARATQLLAVAVGPACNRLVDVDFSVHLVRVRVRVRIRVR